MGEEFSLRNITEIKYYITGFVYILLIDFKKLLKISIVLKFREYLYFAKF